jgi:thiamine-monophosphate kinase
LKSPGNDAGRAGEHAIIGRILGRLPAAPASLVVGPGDDAAVWTPPRGSLQVLTTDALVEGVHFDWRFSSPADVGYKALAVNVSDVAAMGGAPHLALLSLMLPPDIPLDTVDGLTDGLLALAAESRVALAGGNVTRTSGPMVVDLTVVGSARPRKLLRRDGAQPGDFIYVTGALGASAAGLDWLRSFVGTSNSATEAGPADPALAACVTRYRRPEPRARVGALLGRNRAASACMDLSDGLADAVRQIAAASGTGALLDGSALPLHPGARAWFAAKGVDAVEAAAASDDYELLFTVPRRRLGRLRTVVREARGVVVTRIGEVTADGSLEIREGKGRRQLPSGYAHFTNTI